MTRGHELSDYSGNPYPPDIADFALDLDRMDDLIGCSVYSTDRQKLGTVEQVVHPQATATTAHAGHYLLIKPGMLQSLIGVEQVHIPSLHIASVDLNAGSVFLDVPSDMLEA